MTSSTQYILLIVLLRALDGVHPVDDAAHDPGMMTTSTQYMLPVVLLRALDGVHAVDEMLMTMIRTMIRTTIYQYMLPVVLVEH
jgi:hypothetical protein